jgi:hypothetical protein
LREWNALYIRLKKLQEESIQIADIDLQKLVQDAKKYTENVSTARKEEYDDYIKHIQKMAKRIRDEADEQTNRLDDFEEKNMNTEVIENIPDQDIIFLRKEVGRYRASLESVQKQKDTTLEQSVEINGENQKRSLAGNNIKPEDLSMLRLNLKSLEKLAEIDIPRIKKNIDLLEMFTIKTLKNKLNEDNKRSQAKISKMKRNYEDL